MMIPFSLPSIEAFVPLLSIFARLYREKASVTSQLPLGQELMVPDPTRGRVSSIIGVSELDTRGLSFAGPLHVTPSVL
jgi:hypothetical protein